MKKTLLIILIIVVIGALIFLGYYFIYKPSYQNKSQPASNSTQQNQTQSNSSTVSIANFAFDPADLTVKAGTEVTFTNNNSATHTVVFDSFDSGDLKPGDSYKHTFADKGTFNYHCSIHPSMQGKVTVQ